MVDFRASSSNFHAMNAPDDGQPARPAAGAVARALWAGAFAGLAVGAADAFISWGRLGQYLPGVLARLGCVVFTAGLCGFWFALAGGALGIVWTLLARHTALATILARPRTLAGTALAAAAVPVVAAALGGAYLIGVHTIATRNHQGLIITVTVAATFALLALAIPATLVLGRLVELVLRLLPARGQRILTSRFAAPLVVAALVVLGGGAVAFASRALLAQIPIRPYLVVLAWLPLFALMARPARRTIDAIPPRARPFVHPILVVPLVLALVLGGGEAVRKGASAYTGLTTPLVVATRDLFDLDRDGYSSVLGGGDCNDLNASIHPGAYDIPGNGIDEDCSGSDAKLSNFKPRALADVDFATLPASIPADTNVLVITIDTLRADHLGMYGYARATSPRPSTRSPRKELSFSPRSLTRRRRATRCRRS